MKRFKTLGKEYLKKHNNGNENFLLWNEEYKQIILDILFDIKEELNGKDSYFENNVFVYNDQGETGFLRLCTGLTNNKANFDVQFITYKNGTIGIHDCINDIEAFKIKDIQNYNKETILKGVHKAIKSGLKTSYLG